MSNAEYVAYKLSGTVLYPRVAKLFNIGESEERRGGKTFGSRLLMLTLSKHSILLLLRNQMIDINKIYEMSDVGVGLE